MKFITDLHLHSKYSRATSGRMDLENLAEWAKLKGIDVVGTGDFTHPEWFKELKNKLEPAEPGLFQLKGSEGKTHFLLTVEISCIYSKKQRVRKIHLIVFAPDFEPVEKINTRLSWIGNLKADGRPILGLDAKELLKIVLDVCPECLMIPAHLYTPWFSLFGSRSGFDSIEECFEEYSKYIYAGETGLSSDPAMSWRNSSLDQIALVSFGDAHSPQKLGRETTVFDTKFSYAGIVEAIKSKDPNKLLYTIEFFPEEGKYHFDGHRLCGVSLSPQETQKYHGLCPVCGKPLTIGVLARVEKLADRPSGFKPEGAIPYKSLIPLEEIIAEVLGMGRAAKQVSEEYQNLVEHIGSEFQVLLEATSEELERATLPEIAEGILRVREGKVKIQAGYDGVFGKISIFGEGEQKELTRQKTLF